MLALLFGLLAVVSLLILFNITSSFLAFAQTKVPYVPTAARDVRRLVVEGLLRKDDVVYDLGCGNGKVLFLMEKLSGAQGIGYELALWACMYAWVKRLILRSRVTVHWNNFFVADLSRATVVYCYLYPFLMPKVGEKIMAECRPGTKIIVRDFPIKSMHPAKHFYTYGKHEFFIYER